MYVCYMCTGALRGQRRASSPLELGLQAAVRCLMRVWEPNYEGTRNSQATSLAHSVTFKSNIMIYFSRFFLFKKEETVFQVFESFFFFWCIWCFAFMCVCVLCVNLVPMKSRTGIKMVVSHHMCGGN